MGSFNKVLSFILGLVVVIVFIIVLSRRLNFSKNFLPFQSTTPTVTPIAKKDVVPTPTLGFYRITPQPQTKGGQQAVQPQTGTVKSIPSTGSPTAILLALNSTLFLGFYLRRK
jgi:hypothetical protein